MYAERIIAHDVAKVENYSQTNKHPFRGIAEIKIFASQVSYPNRKIKCKIGERKAGMQMGSMPICVPASLRLARS